MRSEYIDVAEGRIAQTCNRTAVVQDLQDFVPALSHHLEPLMRDGSEFTSMLFHPRIVGGIAFDSSVIRSNCALIGAPFSLSDLCYVTPLHEERKGWVLRNAHVAGMLVDSRQIADALIERSMRRIAGYLSFKFWADNGQIGSYFGVDGCCVLRQG